MISDGNIPLTGQPDIDDLPRTLRREHEARAREARERSGQTMSGPTLTSSARPSNEPAFQATDAYDAAAPAGEPFPAVVKALDIPFGDLVAFCVKAVLAAIPALLLLMVILWGVGQILETLVPDLLKMKILISFPNS
jgi:hypothetical protein